MLEKRKLSRAPAGTVYKIDGAEYGPGDGLVEAIKRSICQRLEAGSLEIPRLPQVAGRILELAANPTSDVDDVVQAITPDPLLVTRILTVANSAAYSTGQPISGLSPAVMRLGMKFVQDLVFAESIRLKIFSARAYRSILHESWKLSLAAAIACEQIARLTNVERDGAFLLGLLHDTGKPVLVHAITEHERGNANRPLGEDVVEILLAQLHEEVGAYVLKRWGMPEAAVSAAAAHNAYRGSASTPAQRLVHAANLVCQQLGIGDIQRDIHFTLEHVFADLGLADEARIAVVLETVTRELASLLAGMDDGAEGATRAA